jgi:hypothetical protein
VRSDQPKICKFLLDKFTWPDRSNLLGRALKAYGHTCLVNRPYAETWRDNDVYRLLTSDPDSNTDVMWGWVGWCRSSADLQSAFQGQSLLLQGLSPQARFEIASKLEFCDTSTFLDCVGLQSDDPTLGQIQNQAGVTALHRVAWGLRRVLVYPDRDDADLKAWLDLGLSLLKNGADPLRAAKNDKSDKLLAELVLMPHGLSSLIDVKEKQVEDAWSPLQWFLGLPYVGIHWRSDSRSVLKRLRIWVELLQQAGIEICNYGAKEARLWNLSTQRSCPDGKCGIATSGRQLELIYGSSLEQWGFSWRFFFISEYVQAVATAWCIPLQSSFASHDRMETFRHGV